MGKIIDYFLGRKYSLKKKEEKTIKKKEREAYVKSLTTTRIARAKKLGQQKPRSRLGAVRSVIEGGATGAKSYMEMMGLGDLDLGLGLEPKREKTTKKKKPSRGTTIKVNGTTITIATKRKKKRK